MLATLVWFAEVAVAEELVALKVETPNVLLEVEAPFTLSTCEEEALDICVFGATDLVRLPPSRDFLSEKQIYEYDALMQQKPHPPTIVLMQLLRTPLGRFPGRIVNVTTATR